MIAWTKKWASVGSRGTRALAMGLLVAALLSAFSVGARPAQAETTFTINSTDDYRDFFPDDNLCDFTPFVAGEQCTLRAAIEQANAAAGADTINFAIPGTGVKTIVVNSEGFGALPSITDRVTIDGYTQAGASANTRVVGNDASLRVELTQTGLQDEVGLDLFDPDSSGSVIRGLVINRFGTGIAIRFCECVGNRIQGNFIGTNPAGTLDEGNISSGQDDHRRQARQRRGRGLHHRVLCQPQRYQRG